MVWPVWVINAIIATAVSTAMSYVSFLLSDPAKPQAAGNLNGFPTATSGAPIPVVFGTRVLSAPNVTWWGDVKTVPIIAKQSKK